MAMATFRDLMRLAHGFEGAMALFAAVELDLFSHLEEGVSAQGLAGELGVDCRALTLLLGALVAIGLLNKEGSLFSNGDVASHFLVRGEGYRGNIFSHIHHCWEAWSGLPKVVAEGRPASVREQTVLGGEKERTRNFILGMDDVTRELAPLVAPQVGFDEARVLLDVGGGPGTYAEAFLQACPRLRSVRLFDLPIALEVARERLSSRGLLGRVELVEGDMHVDEFEPGVDAVWISQVFHSQDERGCRLLLAKAFRALVTGGRLAVHEFLLDADGAGPQAAALFALHMLVMTEGGRAYSGEELALWMEEAGFADVEVRRVSEDTGVVTGVKPR